MIEIFTGATPQEQIQTSKNSIQVDKEILETIQPTGI